MESQQPRLYHTFKLSFLWNKLAEEIHQVNNSLSVDLVKHLRLKPSGVSTKISFDKTTRPFKGALKLMQKSQATKYAYFSSHQWIPDQEATRTALLTLQPWFRLNAQHDLQAYYQATLNGLNEAQFFIKGDGAWTGLHAEDCLLSSFNINIGPGQSKWIIVALEDHARLSDSIAKAESLPLSFDIRANWHNFFVSEDFLVKNNIPFEVVLQQPGQAIFVGGHSVHEVINLGHGMNIAWNVAPFTWETLTHLMEGYKLEVHHLKHTPIVPVLRLLHTTLLANFQKFDLDEAKQIAHSFSVT